jgi:hypothetical protein
MARLPVYGKPRLVIGMAISLGIDVMINYTIPEKVTSMKS